MEQRTAQMATLDRKGELELRGKIDDWTKRLSTKPPVSKVKKNPYANNSDYLPIGYLEQELDRLYQLWDLEIVSTYQFYNSIVMNVHLKVLHPTVKVWITRAGSGAAKIQLDKNTGQPLQSSIEKAAGAAKAMAFKNACKSLGRRFGRDLNRNFEDEFEAFYKDKVING